MLRRLLDSPTIFAKRRLQHPNWIVRRAAQATVIGAATIGLALHRRDATDGGPADPNKGLVQQLSSSTALRDMLHAPGIVRPLVGRMCRALLVRLSVAAKMHECAGSESRSFALRFNGVIDQRLLRNLLIWQNHVLPLHLRQDDKSQVDVTLVVLTKRSENEGRLFDLLSLVLMLERFRSFGVFWDEETAAASASIIMSERELSRWRASELTSDMEQMPRDVTRQVDLHGTRGGVKLLQHGRKYANDFLKLALPGRFVIAVGLREREDGTVEPEELELWFGLLNRLHAGDPQLAFVVLNCLAPSQWREWPAHLRFARHQGLTLQDTICLAQIADGYVGVLDILGLAAYSAGRPGIYVPLEDGDPLRSEGAAEPSRTAQIMVGSRRRVDIETALETFMQRAPIHRVDLS